MRHLIAAVGVAALAAPAFAQTKETGTTTAPISTKTDDEEGVPKLSLPTEEDRLAWQRSGFRLALGLAYGRLEGLRGPPNGRLLGAQVRAGLRLDAKWSILPSVQYASASASGGLSGLRFAGTIDPTWHVTPSFSLAVGFGFGGIVEGNTGRPDNTPVETSATAINATYTFPDARTPLPSCSGVGTAGLARAEYTWVLGPRAATSLAFEVIGQYTACIQKTNRLEDDTATPIERHQYWAHVGATLAWGITWR